jgi:tRNA A-37 threonylcarbamoyl transferase component Bud32
MSGSIGQVSVPVPLNLQLEQQSWLTHAAKGGEIRARTDGMGAITVYNAKRGLVGSAVSAIKDAGGSAERVANRLRAAGEFNRFLNDRFGPGLTKRIVGELELGGDSLRASDVGRALDLGRAMEAQALQGVQAELQQQVERVSSFGVQPLDPTGTRPPADTRARGLDPLRIPLEVSKGLEANNGFSTPALIKWLIQDGQLDIGIDRHDPTLNVRPLPRTGSYTGELFAVESQGRLTHVVKESGGPFLFGDNRPTTGTSYTLEDGVLRSPSGYENDKIKVVSDSPIGRADRFDAPGGVKVSLALAPATLHYTARGKTPIEDGPVRQAQFAHEVTVMQAAKGRSVDSILASGTPAERQAAATALGRAIGAMHRQFAGDEVMPTGGLRTLIHGDVHPPNAFYDSASATLTLIDLAGMAYNFDHDPPGFDMLTDVKRAITFNSLAMEHKDLQGAFLSGYAENFTDLTDKDGQPRYSPDKIRTLIADDALKGHPMT